MVWTIVSHCDAQSQYSFVNKGVMGASSICVGGVDGAFILHLTLQHKEDDI
jgi:hypothetical protein